MDQVSRRPLRRSALPRRTPPARRRPALGPARPGTCRWPRPAAAPAPAAPAAAPGCRQTGCRHAGGCRNSGVDRCQGTRRDARPENPARTAAASRPAPAPPGVGWSRPTVASAPKTRRSSGWPERPGQRSRPPCRPSRTPRPHDDTSPSRRQLPPSRSPLSWIKSLIFRVTALLHGSPRQRYVPAYE